MRTFNSLLNRMGLSQSQLSSLASLDTAAILSLVNIKSYSFKFSRDESNGDLSVIDLHNSIGSHGSWERSAVGNYRTLFTSSFDSSKILNCNFQFFDINFVPFFVSSNVSGSYLNLLFKELNTHQSADPSLNDGSWEYIYVNIIQYP